MSAVSSAGTDVVNSGFIPTSPSIPRRSPSRSRATPRKATTTRCRSPERSAPAPAGAGWQSRTCQKSPLTRVSGLFISAALACRLERRKMEAGDGDGPPIRAKKPADQVELHARSPASHVPRSLTCRVVRRSGPDGLKNFHLFSTPGHGPAAAATARVSRARAGRMPMRSLMWGGILSLSATLRRSTQK